jgi:hypothetical protein
MTLEFKNRLLVQRFEQEAPPLSVAEAILPTRVGALKHISLEQVRTEYLASRHAIQADLLRVLRALPLDVHGKVGGLSLC